MRKKTMVLNSLLLAILCASPCFGWGPDGHRIIGLIAASYLNDKAKAAVKDLLGEQTLADVSNWADEVRNDPAFEWSKPLHYINVPRDAAKVDLKRDCAEDQCVIGAINKYAGILRKKDATREDRIQALKFLVHFVGDVHQPLHVSYADDRGANSVKVTFLGKPGCNLHAVWDTGLIEHRLNGGNWSDMAKRIRDDAPAESVKQWRKSSDPVDWANESLAMTRLLYTETPPDGQLDDKYYELNIKVAEDRLAAAGIRLAALLNDIFTDNPATQSASTMPASAPTTKLGEASAPGH